MKKYRLVWFQHLHKAAGTYVVRRALTNGEKPYPLNKNGNPHDDKGAIPLWEMTGEELTEFVDECQELGVTFVATEWGGPDFRKLSEDPRVHLVTCFRHPINRFISNFNFDYYWRWTESKNYSEYLSETEIYSSPEYYTRIFSRNQDPNVEVKPEDLKRAKENLQLFDHIIIAESGMDDLFKLGWVKETDTTHPTYGDKWAMIHLIKKLRFWRLFQYLLRVKHKPGDEINLEQLNTLDIELYDYVKSIDNSI